MLRSTLTDNTIERVLIPLVEAIKNCDQRIENSQSTNNEDYIDTVADYEVEIIENLLGNAFVACQT